MQHAPAYFGLTDEPFPLDGSPRHFVATPGHDEALARLDYLASVTGSGGVLYGASGIGKTLLTRVFAQNQRRRGAAVAVVSGACCDVDRLLQSIVDQWGATRSTPAHSKNCWQVAAERLQELRYQAAPVCLLLDDADRAADHVLNAVAGLLALREASEVTTVVALPQLDALDRRLARRIGLKIELPKWDESDVRQFLAERLSACGGSAGLFRAEAQARLHQHGGGAPRLVAQLARLALLAAASGRLAAVDADTIDEVCRELCPPVESELTEAR